MLQSKQKQLKQNTEKAIRNFFNLPLNQNKDHKKPTKDELQNAIKRVWEPISRNNHISEIFHCPQFQEQLARKRKLKGPASLGVVWCIDGRLDGMSLGVVINLWENPGGIIDVQETADGKLVPSSSELCEHIKHDANSGVDLLEIPLAHFESTNPKHGCAANEGLVDLIRHQGIPANKGHLTHMDMAQISQIDDNHLENANLLIIKKTTVEAIGDYFNKIRVKNNLQPLPRVAIAALYDTATMGIVLRENNLPDLSTAHIAQELRSEIVSKTGNDYGKFRDTFTDPENLFALTKKTVDITQYLMLSSTAFNQKLEKFIQHAYPNLTRDQKQALTFVIAKTTAFQHLAGVADVPAGGPTHPFSKHNEQYMGISVRGEYIGKYDTKPAFGSSAADAKTGVKQIKTKWFVMDSNNADLDKPRIMYVCSSISKHDFENDYKAVKRASGNNAKISREFLENEDIRAQVNTNRLIIVNTLVDDTTGEVLDVLDHSDQY